MGRSMSWSICTPTFPAQYLVMLFTSGLTWAAGLRLEQREGDGDGAAGAGQVQRRGAGAQPRAVAPIAAQHPRVNRGSGLSRAPRV